MGDDDEYLTRVMLHGSISREDVPSDAEVTEEEEDAIVEILFIRQNDEYRVLSRHARHSTSTREGACLRVRGCAGVRHRDRAKRGYPSPQARLHLVSVGDAGELGTDRIFIPWAADDED